MSARKPLVVGPANLVAEIDPADTLDLSNAQVRALLIALGVAFVVHADEAIPANRLVSMYGDPVTGGRNVFLAGAYPANAFAPEAIPVDTQGIVIVSGIVELECASTITTPANLYLNVDGRGADSPGGKGAVSQFVGVAAGDQYTPEGSELTYMPVTLCFGEFSA